MVELVGVDLGDARQQLLGRLGYPRRGAREGQPRQGVRATARDRGHDLLHERPCFRGCADEHLPARLHVDAPVDEQGCIVRKPSVRHECWTLSAASCYDTT